MDLGLGLRLDCTREGSPQIYARDGRPIEVERPFRRRRPRVQLVASTATGQLKRRRARDRP